MDSIKPAEECESIEDVRRSIDSLDRQIVALIGHRARYVDAAAGFKNNASDVRAAERRGAMMDERRRWAEEEGLSPDMIQDLYELLVNHFVNREMEGWRSTRPDRRV